MPDLPTHIYARTLIYIAGPFTAHTRHGVEANISRAVALSLEVAKLGAFPVCPHASTSHPDFEDVQPYQFWIDGTAELLRRCDALILVDGWENSRGARGEKELAHELNKPVFETLEGLRDWLGGMPAVVVPARIDGYVSGEEFIRTAREVLPDAFDEIGEDEVSR